jgi:hypothetical protein
MLFDAAQFMYCIGSASMAGEVFVGREPCMSRTRIFKACPGGAYQWKSFHLCSHLQRAMTGRSSNYYNEVVYLTMKPLVKLCKNASVGSAASHFSRVISLEACGHDICLDSTLGPPRTPGQGILQKICRSYLTWRKMQR